MGGYHTGMACLNGHPINCSAELYHESNSPFCPRCGEQTVNECQACGASLRGAFSEGYSSSEWQPQPYCYNCGKPYPWTQRNAAAIAATLEELDLHDADREKLKQSIPDILSETPMTGAAILRAKRVIRAAGSVGGKILTDVLAKVAAEMVKQQL